MLITLVIMKKVDQTIKVSKINDKCERIKQDQKQDQKILNPRISPLKQRQNKDMVGTRSSRPLCLLA